MPSAARRRCSTTRGGASGTGSSPRRTRSCRPMGQQGDKGAR